MKLENKKSQRNNLRIYQIFFLTGVILATFSCNYRNLVKTDEQVINEYYNSLNSSDYNRIKQCLADSIFITEGDFVLTRNLNDYYIQFQWDSIFRPKYELIDLQKKESKFTATVNKSCQRIEFLHDTLITFEVDIYVSNGRISKLQTVNYLLFDFEKWQSRIDALNEWIERNHPELSGCTTKITYMGAIDYLKAIELYMKNEN